MTPRDGFDEWAAENGLPQTIQVEGDEVVIATSPDLAAIFREAKAREAADPHAMVAEERRRHQGPFAACRCGRVFTATTWGRALSSWKRHHDREAEVS